MHTQGDMSELPTAIEGIKVSFIPVSIYDLSGRRLQQKPTKGIYIQNKRAVLVK